MLIKLETEYIKVDRSKISSQFSHKKFATMYRVSVILVLLTISLNSCYGGPVHKLDNEEVLENAQLDLGPDTEITVIKNITDNDGTNTTKDL